MKLLIGYDGSECADAAIKDLYQAGLPARGEAIVLSVAELRPELLSASVPDPSVVEWSPMTAALGRQAMEHAMAEAEALGPGAIRRVHAVLPEWAVSHETCADSAYWALVRKADVWQPDLVVLGSHGRHGLERFLMGSVSHKVLTHARCSVRIGRRAARSPEAPPHLLIGFDGSPDSEAAVQAVVSRTWPAGTEARVVAVIDAGLSASLPARGEATDDVRRQSPVSYVFKALSGVARELHDAGLEAVPTVLQGDPKRVLVEEAARWPADCIFVAAKGHSRLERFLLGSVSAAVAERAGCSVEVVRRPQNDQVGDS